MSIKATSILRSALFGAAVAALAIAPAMAIDQGFAPRPDFPGAKQGEIHHHYHKHHHHYRSSSHGKLHQAS
ncbi:MAG: hypothetical protein J2P54_25020 [Bradyrhizobiaceae bacterium]|nr:hypothetical protein [Bradyrhizobiaceae bacterium]